MSERAVKLKSVTGFVLGTNDREQTPVLRDQNVVYFESEANQEDQEQKVLYRMVFGDNANEDSLREAANLLKQEEHIDKRADTFLDPLIGMRTPIEVKQHPTNSNEYLLVSGAGRYLSALLAYLKSNCSEERETIRANVVSDSDDACNLISFITNMDHKKLEPLEEATKYATLRNKFKWDDKEIAKKLGTNYQRVYNYRRLNKCDEKVKERLRKGTISVVAALNTLKKNKSENEDEKTNSNAKRYRTMPFKKLKGIYDDVDALKEVVKDKPFDLEAVRYGMAVAMQIQYRPKPLVAQEESQE